VASIGEGAFYDCSGMTAVTFGGSVAKIGEYAFCGCSGLTEITIPDSVTSLERFSFSGCSALTGVTILSGTVKIGNHVFSECGNLAEICFKGNAPTFDKNSFYGVCATAYYPAADDTWTEAVRKNYGGTLTWTPYSDRVVITEQPEDTIVEVGQTALFRVTACGPDLTYQWYWRSSKGFWTAVRENGNGATYSMIADRKHDGCEFRCAVTDGSGKRIISSGAALTVVSRPVIVVQPRTAAVLEGRTVRFTVEATGGALEYTWMYRAPGGIWTAVEKRSGPACEIIASAALNGYQYRCVVRNAAGVVVSRPATLIVKTVRLPVIRIG